MKRWTTWLFACGLLGLSTTVHAQSLTLGWDAPSGPFPPVTAPDEIRYLVEQRLPGATAYTPIFPALPTSQRTLAVTIAPGVAGQQHCFQVYAAHMGSGNVIKAQSAAGTLQSDPTQTALCVPAMQLPLLPPINFRTVP